MMLNGPEPVNKAYVNIALVEAKAARAKRKTFCLNLDTLLVGNAHFINKNTFLNAAVTTKTHQFNNVQLVITYGSLHTLTLPP